MDLGAQVRHPGPVWLDRVRAENLAPYGFGVEVRRLVEQRQHTLRRVEIRPEDPDRIAKLEEVERRAMGKRIAEHSGQRFLDVAPSGFRGRVQVLETGDGTPPYAVVSDGSRFVVRATPETRDARDKTVSVSCDDKGQLFVRRAPDRDRGS
jgi:hypothetical protein